MENQKKKNVHKPTNIQKLPFNEKEGKCWLAEMIRVSSQDPTNEVLVNKNLLYLPTRSSRGDTLRATTAVRRPES